MIRGGQGCQRCWRGWLVGCLSALRSCYVLTLWKEAKAKLIFKVNVAKGKERERGIEGRRERDRKMRKVLGENSLAESNPFAAVWGCLLLSKVVECVKFSLCIHAHSHAHAYR